MKALNVALKDLPQIFRNRKQFVENEITFTDGQSGDRVSNFLLTCVGKHYKKEV